MRLISPEARTRRPAYLAWREHYDYQRLSAVCTQCAAVRWRAAQFQDEALPTWRLHADTVG